MPLFEVETTSHIMIACVDDEAAARSFAQTNYPSEEVLRVSHRPRDAWVISKNLLGLTSNGDPCAQAPRMPGQGAGRQAARGPALHAADRERPGGGPQGHRVEHGDGLVTRSTRRERVGSRPGHRGRSGWRRPGDRAPPRVGEPIVPDVGSGWVPVSCPGRGCVMRSKVICLILGGGRGTRLYPADQVAQQARGPDRRASTA